MNAIKQLFQSVLISGVVVTTAVHADPVAINTLNTSADTPRIATDAFGAPQIIVKFNNAQSFDTGLALMGSASASSVQGQQMLSVMQKEATSRVASLSMQSSTPMAYKRMLANGADLVSLSGMKNQDVATTLAMLEANPAVEDAEPDYMMAPLFVPNDQVYQFQSHYFESAAGINMEPAWDVTTGTGAVVAVIDTGFRPHADLAANIIGGFDFISSAAQAGDGNGRDSNAQDEGDFTSNNQCGQGIPGSSSSWHGTHVAGTVAAITNNNAGVAGVAFGAKVVGSCG